MVEASERERYLSAKRIFMDICDLGLTDHMLYIERFRPFEGKQVLKQDVDRLMLSDSFYVVPLTNNHWGNQLSPEDWKSRISQALFKLSQFDPNAVELVTKIFKSPSAPSPSDQGSPASAGRDETPEEATAAIAKEMRISADQVKLEWRAAKAWLRVQVYGDAMSELESLLN
jgi:hypothetical protein